MKEEKSILAKNLIKYRKRFGVTQDVIASAVGVERSCYAHYEKTTTPPADILCKLARVLRVTTDQLLFPEEQIEVFNEITAPVVITFNELNPEEKELLLKWRLLSDQSKETLKKSIELHISKED